MVLRIEQIAFLGGWKRRNQNSICTATTVNDKKNTTSVKQK